MAGGQCVRLLPTRAYTDDPTTTQSKIEDDAKRHMIRLQPTLPGSWLVGGKLAKAEVAEQAKVLVK